MVAVIWKIGEAWIRRKRQLKLFSREQLLVTFSLHTC